MKLPQQATPIYRERLATLCAALGRPLPPGNHLATQLAAVVQTSNRAEVWLALAVMTARLPVEGTVREVSRRAQLEPGQLFAAIKAHTTPASLADAVEVETERILVDVTNTAASALRTGIQRVAREVAKRWSTDARVRFVSWANRWEAMTDLVPEDVERLRNAQARDVDGFAARPNSVVVPWHTSYVLLEVAGEAPRADRLRAMAHYGEVDCGALVYDLIPVTSSETNPAMTAPFISYLTALKYIDRICAISHAAASEYAGWEAMLRGAGVSGPAVSAVLLPAVVAEPTPGQLAAASEQLLVGHLPMVLVVGSHEPRKNHLAILHAAQVLWGEGCRFSLTFIGGGSWLAEEFTATANALQAGLRPIQVVTAASDELLWAAYRLARFTVFPSFNEGYGLPLAESLAMGTPAITSKFGSTREIVDSGGGALLVNPRSDEELIDAMRELLTDDAVLARLREECAARPPETWDAYAAQVAQILVPKP